MLSSQDAADQQSGGIWTEIIRPDSWTNRVPVLAWLVLVQVIALLAVPITFVVFRPLPDRGYLFSKVLGLLGVGLVVWLLASVRWMAFSRASIGLAILMLALVSALVLARRRREIVSFVRERWPILLIWEAVSSWRPSSPLFCCAWRIPTFGIPVRTAARSPWSWPT